MRSLFQRYIVHIFLTIIIICALIVFGGYYGNVQKNVQGNMNGTDTPFIKSPVVEY